MHELSLMEALREQVLEAAAQHGARRILAVHLRIGSLAGVEPQALRFAFAVVMGEGQGEGEGEGEGIGAGARLEIEAVAAEWLCPRCAEPFADGPAGCECPRCGGFSRRLLRGRELELAALEIE